MKAKGVALVNVLVVGVLLVIALSILNVSVLSELRKGGTVRGRDELVQAADSLSERARLALALDYRTSGLSVPAYLNRLRADTRVHTAEMGNGIEGRWRILAVSPPGSEYGWVDVAATASRGERSQTVVRRISFGQNDVFRLAMLSETTNCMYCHLRVHGDVGALYHHRPGWGSERAQGCPSLNEPNYWVDGCHSGWGSVIYGNLYAARTITRNATDVDIQGRFRRDTHQFGHLRVNGYYINGSVVTGTVEEGSRNPALPQDVDGDGIPDFPPIRRSVAEASANGTLRGGLIVALSPGQTLTGLPAAGALGVNGVHNGNLILIGTPENPIEINGDIYVTGDVIIKGVVKGRGAIYAGRNLYVAGNVTYANPPDPPGQGVCQGVTDPDACSRRNIGATKDELRLAARGTIVVGDYTERDAAGNLLPYDLRQSSDFYRYQFSFHWDTHYYHRTTGEELIRRGDRYYTVEGTEVPAGEVLVRQSDINNPQRDAYSFSFRPGQVDANGNFQPWIPDHLYRSLLLGEMRMRHNTWRWGFWVPQEGEKVAWRNRVRDELVRARLPSGVALRVACVLAAIPPGQNGCPSNLPSTNTPIPLTDARGNQIGAVHIDRSSDTPGSWQILRVIRDEELPYENQVTRVDAFLYANFRIAGKTSMLGMVINGGAVAKYLGILAPGRYGVSWWAGSRYGFLDSPTDPRRECNAPGQAYYVEGSEDCRFTIRYDYRLRNGGYGFHLVQGNPGQTLGWRISDNPAERVRP